MLAQDNHARPRFWVRTSWYGFDTEVGDRRGSQAEISQKPCSGRGDRRNFLERVKRKGAEGFVDTCLGTKARLIDFSSTEPRPQTTPENPHSGVVFNEVILGAGQWRPCPYRRSHLRAIPIQPDQKEHLHQQAGNLQTLFDTRLSKSSNRDLGRHEFYMTLDIPSDGFASTSPPVPAGRTRTARPPGPTPMRWT